MNYLKPNLAVTHIPFDLGGKIYRGRQPSVENHKFLNEYKKVYGITHIFLLQTDTELKKSGCENLKTLYTENGYVVEHCPIEDCYVIEQETMKEVIAKIIKVANQGNDVLVHCKGGMGRTGMVLSCLAMEALHLSAESSMDFIAVFLGTKKPEYKSNFFQKDFIESYAKSISR